MAWMTLPGGSSVARASVNVPVPQPRSHHVCARAPAIWSIRINSVASAMYIAIWLCELGSFRLQGYCHFRHREIPKLTGLLEIGNNFTANGRRPDAHNHVSNSQLKLLTWQELAAVLPGNLQNFLAAKYGIFPAIVSAYLDPPKGEKAVSNMAGRWSRKGYQCSENTTTLTSVSCLGKTRRPDKPTRRSTTCVDGLAKNSISASPIFMKNFVCDSGNRVPERSDWEKISSSWTKRIDERIAELGRLREGLTR